MASRGGYCFESNSLLAKALAALGFEIYCVAANNVLRSSDQEVGLLSRTISVATEGCVQTTAWQEMQSLLHAPWVTQVSGW